MRKDTFLQEYKGYNIFRRDNERYGLRCHYAKKIGANSGLVYFADGIAETQIQKCKDFIDTL